MKFKDNINLEQDLQSLGHDLKKNRHLFLKPNPSLFRPQTLISPKYGLINDPCGIFYTKDKYHILFQHHPLDTNHGLKFYSLAKTSNFIDYEYFWLVNCPDKEFDRNGCFTGSCFLQDDQHCLLYTGNVNLNNENIQTLIKATIDANSNMIVDKQMLLSNLKFSNVITNNFRDPYSFKFQNQNYFLMGIGAKNGRAQIWLFSQNFDKTLPRPKIALLKRFEIASSDFIVAECPNIIFSEKKVALIFGLIPKKQERKFNLSKTYYCIFSHEDFFNFEKKTEVINKVYLLDYGFDFYAPQFFADKKGTKMIAWAGHPEIVHGAETNDNWFGCLTPMKNARLVYDRIVTNLLPEYVDYVKSIDSPQLMLKEIDISANKSFYANIYDDERLVINLIYDGPSQIFELERFHHLSHVKMDNRRRMRLSKPLTKVSFLFDTSYFQIDLNEGQYVLTGRIYPENGLQFIHLNKIDKLASFTTKIFEDL